MKIRMTTTVQGSLDGVTVQELVAGDDYETVNTPRGDRLARYHIKQGAAVAVPTIRKVSVKRPAKKATWTA